MHQTTSLAFASGTRRHACMCAIITLYLPTLVRCALQDAEYSYTQEGVKTVTKIDYIPVQTAASATAKLPTGAKKPANGASSSAHVGLVGLALALLAAATVL